jgi:hypothetical protein
MAVARRSPVSPQRHGRSDPADAFFPDPGDGPARVADDLAEELAEEFLASATTGQEQAEEALDQFVEEEIGGPFVTSPSNREFAYGFDESNIPGTQPEPYPTVGPTTSLVASAEEVVEDSVPEESSRS